MKRAKLALAIIAIAGVVGGAVSFKIKTPFPMYCIGPTTTTRCTGCITAGSTITDGVPNVHYVATNNCAGCVGYTRCTLNGRAVPE